MLVLAYLLAGELVAQPPAPVNGQAIFTANCGACHGMDGRGGERAPSIATRREVIKLSNADLFRTVQNGLGGNGMPGFGYLGGEKIHAVVNYLRTLQGFGVSERASGDALLGEKLFYGKADCHSCHMVDGRGGFIAEDLTGYGLGQSPGEIRRSILEPDNKPGQPEYVTLVTTRGRRYIGLVRAQDNFSLTLQTQSGQFLTIPRDEIDRVEPNGQTLMPDNYAATLNTKEIDDLVTYLLKAGSGKSTKKADDDEE